MDYSSIGPSSSVLAATGLGLFSGVTGQLWLLGIAALVLGGMALLVRTRFRRGKSANQV